MQLDENHLTFYIVRECVSDVAAQHATDVRVYSLLHGLFPMHH